MVRAHRFAKNSLIALAAAAALPTLMPGWAGAATYTWDNDTVTAGAQDGGGLWDFGTANWYDGANNLWANGGADSAVFGAGGVGAPVTLATTMNVAGVAFDVTDYTLTGGALNVNGATPISLNVAGVGSINSIIQGAGPVAFSVNSGGTLNLGAANTYTGGASLSGGTLDLGAAGTLPGSLSITSGALHSTQARTISTSLDVPTGSSAVMAFGTGGGDGNGTLSGNLTGGGILTLASGGSSTNTRTWSFGGDKTAFTGTITVASGNSFIRLLSATAASGSTVYDLRGGGSATIGARGGNPIPLGAVFGDSDDFLVGRLGAGSDIATFQIGGKAGVDSEWNGRLTNSTSTRRLAIEKVGAATTLTLGGTGLNDYAGNTTITGGILRLASDDRISDVSSLIMNGGTFDTDGFDDDAATLGLTASSIIDMGDGASILSFGNSSALSWTGVLTIANWSGSTSGGGTDQIFVGTDATGLTQAQLAMIHFVGYDPGATILSTGEVVVPEPTIVTGLLLAGLAGISRRRNRRD